jgi:hypothetical protein
MSLDERFIDVFENITSTYITKDWAPVLQQRSPEEWLAVVKKHTQKEVIELLDKEEPPTFAELQALPVASKNNEAGVYANLLEGVDGARNVVYCGSASRTSSNYRGFAGRIRDHEMAPPRVS